MSGFDAGMGGGGGGRKPAGLSRLDSGNVGNNTYNSGFDTGHGGPGHNRTNQSTSSSGLTVGSNRVFSIDLGKISTPNKQRFYGSIACGEQHALVIDRGGSRCWSVGSNINYQLGITNTDFSKAKDVYLVFHPIEPVLYKKVFLRQVAAAGQHSVCVDRNGAVWVFGDNSYSQLGLDSKRFKRVEEPIILPSMTEHKVRQVSTGSTHTMFLL